MDRRIVAGILHGDLLRRRRLPENSKLRRALYEHETQSTRSDIRQPVVYGNYLVNTKSGHPLSWRQMKKILDVLRAYEQNATLANSIDNQVGGGPSMKQSKDGVRRYFTNTSQEPFSDERRKKTKSFCLNLEKRLSEAQSLFPDYNPIDPMPTAMAEYGYTLNKSNRVNNHKNHVQSNYLMNLTEAVSRHLFLDEYKAEFFVVYCIPYSSFVAVAEHFISDIG